MFPDLRRKFPIAAIISTFLTISTFLLAGLLACTGSVQIHPDNFSSRNLSRVASLIQRYGEIEVPVCSEQFRIILRRLRVPDSEQFSVRILDTPQPAAFSPGARVIFISRGLVRLLSSEAQVAFAIAHELSHYQLEHLEEAADVTKSERAADEVAGWRKEIEMAADRHAMALLVGAGYEPAEAVAALQLVYRRVSASPERALYPSLAERISAMAQLITTARSRLGPGTVSRRDFAHCRASLP